MLLAVFPEPSQSSLSSEAFLIDNEILLLAGRYSMSQSSLSSEAFLIAFRDYQNL